MKYLRNNLYLGILLLTLLSACGGATPPVNTPVPTGLVNLNPHGPLIAVTGVAPISLAPPCSPPAQALSQDSAFCANQAAGIGGANLSDTTSFENIPANETELTLGDVTTGNATCTWDDPNNPSTATCTGPQNGKFQEMGCQACIPNNAPQGYVSSGGSFACSSGYTKDNQGNCVPIDPTKAYNFCPSGTHYDNALQNCADDVTNKLASPCPAGHQVQYIPDMHMCLANTFPEVYNCQTVTFQLGACLTKVNKVGQCASQGLKYLCYKNSDGRQVCSCK